MPLAERMDWDDESTHPLGDGPPNNCVVLAIAFFPRILKAHYMIARCLRMVFALLLTISAGASAAVAGELADIFADNMVLQQQMPIRVWGTGTPGAAVTVTFGLESQSSVVEDQGKWSLNLPAMLASGEPRSLRVVIGTEHVSVENVLVGEVWHASGQSNMAWSLAASAKKLPGLSRILMEADYPAIRYRAIKRREQRVEQWRIGDGADWVECTPKTAGAFSAVALLFARQLHLELGVPIGIIETAWGGHPIEPFIPVAAFTEHPVLEQERRLGELKDLEGLKAMVGGVWARNESWLPGAIYNARIAPIAGYSMRGALWYQAESNCGTGEDPRYYSEKMKALVRGWRAAWAQSDMPVYFVQLPQYPSPGWRLMRDEQRRALSEPNTGMAVTIDLELDGIHPANKLEVAERLALWALGRDYGRIIPVSGPLFRSASFEGDQARIAFDHVGEGLVTGSKRDLQAVEILEGKSVNGFELAGVDGVWMSASAVIEGRGVRCKSDQVPEPIAVRYAYASTMPEDRPWNLYNRAGLPASPFVSEGLRYSLENRD